MAGIDPSAVAFASRRADDRWFCWEQPDRDGFALAGIGSAAEVVSRGEGRESDLRSRIALLMRGRLFEEPLGLPAGAGPVWTGGMAFDPDGGSSPHWSSLPPALMVLPELAMHRRDDRGFVTLSAVIEPGVDIDAMMARLGARVGSMRDQPLPPFDPHPGARAEVASAQPPENYEKAVASAVGEIKSGAFDKVVLAREVRVTSTAAHDVPALYGAIRDAFDACFCFCVGSPEAAFIGASPELLVRRSGAVAATVALAGSTRRSADPAVDDHLGEQLLRSAKDTEEHRIVADRIKRSLDPLSVWVQAADEPSIAKVANIQHLATPIHAQLAEPHSVLELAGLLHPTPAVGGEPRDVAVPRIAEFEQMDRGWYAGPVGWMDSVEDGEFCVALRSALIRDRVAHLYAGAGIVAGSDPASELAETEVKLGALLPLLAG